MLDDRPIGFFVHHQGRGHARRCEAIIRQMPDRPIAILTADRSLFTGADDRVTFIDLPDMIGDPPRTDALAEQQTPRAMHCVPMGSRRLQKNAGLITRFLAEEDPSLFVVDVSAEWALLSRLCSVPAVTMRLHGDRNDVGHLSAFEASAGILAPFSEELEQDDYPDWARRKTFYSGGLCTTTDAVPARAEARSRLGLPDDRHVIVVMSGGGGQGAHYASLTMGARALPDSLWLTVGPLYKEGHETDFSNLRDAGWVDDPLAYLAAADIVIASAGDNTVHEIARVGRPFLCVPEWRYFNEQVRKAGALAEAGGAHCLVHWPASEQAWREAVAATRTIDIQAQKRLYEPKAPANAAQFLLSLEDNLWSGETDEGSLPRDLKVVG